MKSFKFYLTAILIILSLSATLAQSRSYNQDYFPYKTINKVSASYRWKADCKDCGHWLLLRFENESQVKKKVSGRLIVLDDAGNVMTKSAIELSLNPGQVKSGDSYGLSYAYHDKKYRSISTPPGKVKIEFDAN